LSDLSKLSNRSFGKGAPHDVDANEGEVVDVL